MRELVISRIYGSKWADQCRDEGCMITLEKQSDSFLLELYCRFVGY